MKRQEFEFCIEKLKGCYGQARYPQERVTALWDRLNEVPFQDFKAAVSNLIANKSNAPMLDDFLSALKTSIGEMRQEEIKRKLASVSNCVICKNLGIVIVKKSPDGYESYSFRCECKRGNLFYPSLETIEEFKKRESMRAAHPRKSRELTD